MRWPSSGHAGGSACRTEAIEGRSQCMEISANIGPALWLLMTAGGAALLGVALAFSLISTRRRRDNPIAQRLTSTATRELYREEEKKCVDRSVFGANNSSEAGSS